jgi:lipopolysaccharide transport system ATP-binding protein
VSNDIVLQVSNIRKRFKIFSSPWSILKEWFSFGLRSYHTDYWALKNVSFEVFRGEFVGIIGPNGAGKSTLLRIITDVLPATSGGYKVNGRVLSILELSGGTDKDLTGRENVIRSGQLLGFPDGYVQERMERIKEFSELGDFFDQPLRMYSTGMKTRLSFSMFAFMDTDILILDEVLAVGDIFFKQKCFARLAELIEQKTSIILVTHSMGVIQRYCDRVIVLNEGEKKFEGKPDEAIRLFMRLHGDKQAEAIQKEVVDEEDDGVQSPAQPEGWKKRSSIIPRPDNWPPEEVFHYTSFPELRGKGRVDFRRLAVLNDQGEPALVFKQGDRMHIYCEFCLKRDIEMPVMSVEVRDKFNLLVHAKNTIQNRAELPAAVARGEVVHSYQGVTLNLAPGNYIIHLYSTVLPGNAQDRLERKGHQNLANNTEHLWRLERAFAVSVQPRFDEDLEVLHGGLCDLPGESMVYVLPMIP